MRMIAQRVGEPFVRIMKKAGTSPLPGYQNKNVASEETEMSAWPRQPRIRQKIPPGYALIWFQTRRACNQSLYFLRLRSLADMQRRYSAGKVLKRHLAKTGLL